VYQYTIVHKWSRLIHNVRVYSSQTATSVNALGKITAASRRNHPLDLACINCSRNLAAHMLCLIVPLAVRLVEASARMFAKGTRPHSFLIMGYVETTLRYKELSKTGTSFAPMTSTDTVIIGQTKFAANAGFVRKLRGLVRIPTVLTAQMMLVRASNATRRIRSSKASARHCGRKGLWDPSSVQLDLASSTTTSSVESLRSHLVSDTIA